MFDRGLFTFFFLTLANFEIFSLGNSSISIHGLEINRKMGGWKKHFQMMDEGGGLDVK